MAKRKLRKHGRKARKAWAVFSREPGGTSTSFADKGQAQAFVKRLKKSHPGEYYDIRSLVVPSHLLVDR